MKGFPPKNRLNNCFGRNAIRLLGVLFLVSLLTPRHFASGETVRLPVILTSSVTPGVGPEPLQRSGPRRLTTPSNTLAGLLMHRDAPTVSTVLGIKEWRCGRVHGRRYLAGNCGSACR